MGIRKKILEDKKKAEQKKNNRPVDTNNLTAVMRIWIALDRINKKLTKKE